MSDQKINFHLNQIKFGSYIKGKSLSVVRLNVCGELKVKKPQGGNEPVEDNVWLWNNNEDILWDNGNKIIIK